MFDPNQFQVNEAWIAFQVNEEFLFVQGEPYDIHLLMDAASGYVLGHVLYRVVDGAPQQKDIEDLFRRAWEAKRQWAEKLIIANRAPADETFRKQAEMKGISVQIVSSKDLEPIIAPLKESFASDFMGRAT